MQDFVEQVNYRQLAGRWHCPDTRTQHARMQMRREPQERDASWLIGVPIGGEAEEREGNAPLGARQHTYWSGTAR